MKLSRDNVTVASRIMLPTYAAHFAVIGVNYLLTSRDYLTESPALAYADSVMALPAWGVLFLGVSLVMVVAMARGKRQLYRYALSICILSMLIWATVFVLAALLAAASPAAWVWPAFVATACYATYRSLGVGEVH